MHSLSTSFSSWRSIGRSMAEHSEPRELPAPFEQYEAVVRDEWLDYNGHMDDSSYAIVLSDANEVLFEALDLSAGYRETSGAAYYTVDTRIRFLAECSAGQTLTAKTT